MTGWQCDGISVWRDDSMTGWQYERMAVWEREVTLEIRNSVIIVVCSMPLSCLIWIKYIFSKSRQLYRSAVFRLCIEAINWIRLVTACLKDRQYTCTRNIEALSCNHRCRGKAVNILFSECLSVALVFQHAMRMRRIILPSVDSLAVPYFSTLSDKWHDFRKTVIEIKMWFDFLYNFCLKHFSF